MANFTLFTTFPIFCHQSISFLEKSQKFLFCGGTSANFLSFSNFPNRFTSEWLTMTHNGQFCQKSSLDWLQMANFGHFAGFSIFSSKMRLRLTQNGQFHPIHNFSHLCHQSISFWRNLKNFCSAGVHQQIFVFLNFLNCFTLKQLTMTHNGEFCQKSGLDWLQTANFVILQVFLSFPSKSGSD